LSTSRNRYPAVRRGGGGPVCTLGWSGRPAVRVRPLTLRRTRRPPCGVQPPFAGLRPVLPSLDRV